MTEVEIEGQIYRPGKLKLRTAFHVGRRILPLVARIAPVAAALDSGQLPPLEVLIRAIQPAVLGLSELSDADSDYVLNECLKVVKIKRQGTWHNVWNTAGNCLQFDDDTLSVFAMVRLVFEVVKESGLINFQLGLDPSSTEPERLSAVN